MCAYCWMKWLMFSVPASSLGIVSVCGVCACACLCFLWKCFIFPNTGFGIAYKHYPLSQSGIWVMQDSWGFSIGRLSRVGMLVVLYREMMMACMWWWRRWGSVWRRWGLCQGGESIKCSFTWLLSYLDVLPICLPYMRPAKTNIMSSWFDNTCVF